MGSVQLLLIGVTCQLCVAADTSVARPACVYCVGRFLYAGHGFLSNLQIIVTGPKAYSNGQKIANDHQSTYVAWNKREGAQGRMHLK
jgi:hypothetical protein